MAADARVILLEFNELTPSLLDRFMNEGHLPNFKRFHDEALVYVTDAEESGDRLNPWVQWVTVHSGLAAEEHGVLMLDESHRLTAPCLWDILSARGLRVFVCGSMNVRYDEPLNGVVLPDPWSEKVGPYPPRSGLDPYLRFIRTQVQEYTKDQVPLSVGDYLRFLWFMMTHGLSRHTVASIVRQLASERLGGGRWKRAFMLDLLQFDVFRSLYRRDRPRFSTFFLNSTAHMQHYYWRHMDPDPFTLKPAAAEKAQYGEAVLFGYRQMDDLLARFMKLAGEDVTLVFATALGQQPYVDRESAGGKQLYRPRNFDGLLAFAGITIPYSVSPVMAEQFHVDLRSKEDADEAERLLRSIQVDRRPLLLVVREDTLRLCAGAGIFDEIPETATVTAGGVRSVPFYELFYRVGTIKSGKHHPHGAFWIRTPERTHRRRDEPVSLRAVAPTILDLFGSTPPASMCVPPLATTTLAETGTRGVLSAPALARR